MNDLHTKVVEINQIVNNQTENVTDNYGLFSGLAGEILFLYYYEKFCGKQQYSNIRKKVSILTESVEKFNSSPSFCSGMSGVLYLIEFLRQEHVINYILDNEIDDYINKSIQYYILNDEYDLLYGLTGLAQYLLLRPDKYLKQLLNIVDYLENSKLTIGNTFAWKKNTKDEVDLALSHGMSSIIYFLTKMLEIVKQKDKNRLINLIQKSCEFIISNKNILTQTVYSFFPYSVALNDKLQQPNSRLAWCYGDLSIGITLFNAGKAIHDEHLLNNAESILIHSAINR